MDTAPRQYVKDLKNWNLPHVEDLEDSLIDELVAFGHWRTDWTPRVS